MREAALQGGGKKGIGSPDSTNDPLEVELFLCRHRGLRKLVLARRIPPHQQRKPIQTVKERESGDGNDSLPEEILSRSHLEDPSCRWAGIYHTCWKDPPYQPCHPS